MTKIIAEVVSLPNGYLDPRVYCVDQSGSAAVATSLTLCDALWELRGVPILKLKDMIRAVSEGRYMPLAPELPDMSVNEKLIWIRPPFANHGEICISNENVPDLSIDEGAPQRFTLTQFDIAMELITSFSAEIARSGLPSLVGRRFEVDLPAQ